MTDEQKLNLLHSILEEFHSLSEHSKMADTRDEEINRLFYLRGYMVARIPFALDTIRTKSIS